jgi:hypothetical protein
VAAWLRKGESPLLTYLCPGCAKLKRYLPHGSVRASGLHGRTRTKVVLTGVFNEGLSTLLPSRGKLAIKERSQPSPPYPA